MTECEPKTGRFFRRPCLAHTAVVALAMVLAASVADLRAQGASGGNTLSLTSREATLGGIFSLFIEATTDRPFTGFQTSVRFPEQFIELRRVTLLDTAFMRRDLVSFDAFFRPNRDLFLSVRQDVSAGDVSPLPAGKTVRVARLDFKLGLGFDFTAGDAFTVDLPTELVPFQFTPLFFDGDAGFAADSVSGGQVTSVADNFIRVRNTDAVRLGELVSVEVGGFNVDPLQGFSLAMQFDPELLAVVNVKLDGTITEATGAEYLAPIIDNENGLLSVGVLLDSNPPFEGQQIPVAGFDVPLAVVDVEAIGIPLDDTGTDVGFLESVGNPPIRNTFVINNQSVPPRTQGGRVSFLFERPFLRGDANQDDMVDMSDAVAMLIWVVLSGDPPPCEKVGDTNDDGVVGMPDILHLLFYLFRGGQPVAPPFPDVGLDPTPDDLFCHS